MRLFVLIPAAVFLALSIRQSPETAPGETLDALESARDVSWYTPVPEDFRPIYDRDPINRRQQTWDQYWKWVKAFYEGTFISHGWTERSKRLVAVVRSDVEQKRLRATINVLGKEIGGEWAKDYHTRAINSADLLAWGKALEKARDKDDGSGA